MNTPSAAMIFGVAMLITGASSALAGNCPCDWDNNGVLNQDDMDAFVIDWFNRDPRCDFLQQHGGAIVVQQIFDFECCLNAGSTGTFCGTAPPVWIVYPGCPSGAAPQVSMCAGDFNRNGDVTPQDLFEFLAAYFAGQSSADVNRSGENTVQDIFDFLENYFSPCPI